MRAARWMLLLLLLSCHRSSIDELGDLPLVEIPPLHDGAPLAVFVSGDGGWRAIDRRVAEGLHGRGYGVVGLIASRFFASRRSPEEASLALARILDHYTRAWHTRQAITIGYSRGAGVLPFMINRLPPRLRRDVTLVALIGLERTIDFQVTPFDLLRSRPTPVEIPVRDEVEKLRDTRVLCIYGVREEDSLCRELPPLLVVRVPEPGSHHFAGNYDQLARTIWTYARLRRA